MHWSWDAAQRLFGGTAEPRHKIAKTTPCKVESSRYFGVGANCGITVVLRGTLDSRFSKSAGTLFRTGP